MIKHWTRCLGLLVAVSVLSACGDNSDLDRKIQDIKNSPGEPIPPLPTVAQYAPFIYESEGLRDPFIPVGDLLGGVAALPVEDPEREVIVPPEADPTRRREFLETFELDSLEMVGTLDWESTLYGLISDPDGLVHRVRLDNFMGRNNGKITAIRDDHIELKEFVFDGIEWQEENAELKLEER